MILQKCFMKTVNRITKDFKHKELLPLKLVFFVQATTISVLYPYLTIHMRELGINVEEAAIMSAVIPVIGIIMPPLAGMVADKIGNFKLLLAFFSLIGGGAALLLLLVPVGRVSVTYPERVILDFGCSRLSEDNSGFSQGYFQLGLSNSVSCEQTLRLNNSESKIFELDTRLEACGFVCQSSNRSSKFEPKVLQDEKDLNTPADPILSGRSYSILIATETGEKSYHFNLTKEEVPKMQTKESALSHRIMASDEYLLKSIRRLGTSEYFFPATSLSQLTCKKVPKKSASFAERLRRQTKELKEYYVCFFGAPGEGEIVEMNNKMQFNLMKVSGNKSDSHELNSFKSEFMSWSSPKNFSRANLTCENSYSKEQRNISVFVYVHDSENNLEILETLPLTYCRPRCLVSALRKTMCTNLKKEILYNPQLTFWSYLVIRVFIGIIGSTSYAMYECAVIAILREQKGDYGLQRIYALIGAMISSPLSGVLIDYASQGKSYTDFRPAFYLYAGLKAATSILMLFINLEFKKASSHVISDAIQVLKNLEIIALLTACFVLGSAWGYIESFLFWFLEDLGGTRSLMGITITVGGIAGIPLLILSGPIIDKIGHANVIFIGFIFYAVRLVGYSLIHNPYDCLYFEAMESFTSSLAITASVTYAAKLSTTTTDGSIQGLVGGMYFGVGRGAGSLIGGFLMNAFGTRPTYRIFAVFCILTGFIYYIFNRLYILKRPRVEGNEICKKEPKPPKNVDSEVEIITEKPKNGSKGKVDANDNMNSEESEEKIAQINEGYDESEEEKKEYENNSHSNSCVPHEDMKNIKNEMKENKKDD